ncbi:MAG: Gfo/Idh/MocA family oxidoreductase [Clostridia bacterium]|nr:Gfo/Idh/MocA family oxidoreductase [Clostridia bacterium]
MSKIKVGVFGGGRGSTMVWQLLNHPDAELVAVCDKYPPVLKACGETAAKAGVKVALYETFDEFIKHDMDAVVLANYANEHAIFAVKCLEAGKHVMSEVLPGETPAQIVKLIETVQRTGLVYSYAENYCYMKPTFEMWKRYRNGDIGEIQYAEGEYVHDCSSIRPWIMYGDKNHWRMRMFPTFYCTHSCGPLITISGLRAVKVVGFETNKNYEEKQMRIASPYGAALEMITLENGAIVKSLHGGLKIEPSSINYQVYGTKGMMQSKRYGPEQFNIYQEGPKLCQGEWNSYEPVNDIGSNIESKSSGHGGSDFYTTHVFLEKILGRPDGEWSIGVLQAANMGMCGIMAWRSVVAGNQSMDIPDFSVLSERDKFRNDNICTSPEIAGDKALPTTMHGKIEFPDSVYDNLRKKFLHEESDIDDLF